jgi:hypothetical protein
MSTGREEDKDKGACTDNEETFKKSTRGKSESPNFLSNRNDKEVDNTTEDLFKMKENSSSRDSHYQNSFSNFDNARPLTFSL